MRVLFSTIGSRGDVQPLVALASHLKLLGHEVRVCVPPDFREWIESLGLPVIPIGPQVRGFAGASGPAPTQPPAPLTAEQGRHLMDETIATQFETLTSAAHGCHVIVATTALQVAPRSVAEKMGIPTFSLLIRQWPYRPCIMRRHRCRGTLRQRTITVSCGRKMRRSSTISFLPE